METRSSVAGSTSAPAGASQSQAPPRKTRGPQQCKNCTRAAGQPVLRRGHTCPFRADVPARAPGLPVPLATTSGLPETTANLSLIPHVSGPVVQDRVVAFTTPMASEMGERHVSYMLDTRDVEHQVPEVADVFLGPYPGEMACQAGFSLVPQTSGMADDSMVVDLNFDFTRMFESCAQDTGSGDSSSIPAPSNTVMLSFPEDEAMNEMPVQDLDLLPTGSGAHVPDLPSLPSNSSDASSRDPPLHETISALMALLDSQSMIPLPDEVMIGHESDIIHSSLPDISGIPSESQAPDPMACPDGPPCPRKSAVTVISADNIEHGPPDPGLGGSSADTSCPSMLRDSTNRMQSGTVVARSDKESRRARAMSMPYIMNTKTRTDAYSKRVNTLLHAGESLYNKTQAFVVILAARPETLLQGKNKFYVSPNLLDDTELKMVLQGHLDEISTVFQEVCQMHKGGLRDRLEEQRQKARDSQQRQEQAERAKDDAIQALERARMEYEVLAKEMEDLRAERMTMA